MVDEGEQVVAVRAGGVAQIHHRHLVAVVSGGNGAVVSGQISLGIQGQKAHAAGTGIFHVGVQKVSCLAHAGGADHQAVDVVTIHQSGQPVLFPNTAQHQALHLWELLSLSPQGRPERYPLVALADLLLRGPAGGSVLAVAHRLVLDAVQAAPVGEGGNRNQSSEYQGQQSNQHPVFVYHGLISSFSVFEPSSSVTFWAVHGEPPPGPGEGHTSPLAEAVMVPAHKLWTAVMDGDAVSAPATRSSFQSLYTGRRIPQWYPPSCNSIWSRFAADCPGPSLSRQSTTSRRC